MAAPAGFDIYLFLQRVIVGNGLPEWVLSAVVALLKAAVILGFTLFNALFLIWLERKVSGRIQNRVGPMRVGPHGLLQTLADVVKLISKEDIVPARADRWIFVLAPIVAFVPALMVYVVLPFSEHMVARDLPIAVIYISALTSITAVAFLMAGWSSNNKWSLLGAMRSAAQLISYEVPLVLAVVAVVMMAGSLSLQEIVRAQTERGWFILTQPIGFLVFLVAQLAELNRGPFDLSEAESELVAGYNTEYSGFRWSVFFLAEYTALVSAGAVATTLYFGGWSGPYLPPLVWFLLKTYLFVFVAMWIRWTLPRIRVDHLMELGWKGLIPIALLNIGVTGLFLL
ncbi:MAG TPA: NADH-quinone oxidoreductase subunit NuoH [Limnochordia bacterium]